RIPRSSRPSPISTFLCTGVGRGATSGMATLARPRGARPAKLFCGRAPRRRVRHDVSGSDPSGGAFVVTWNRPEPLRRSLETLLRQTWPPDAIFVLDNGEGDDALRVTQDVGGGRIPYRRTGDNLGPAGGIALGMRWLVELGFEWILVNDDDNWLWRDDI